MFIYEGTNNLVSGAFLKCFSIDISRNVDYDELIKYNLNVISDRRFVPGTTLVGPRPIRLLPDTYPLYRGANLI